MKADIPDGFRSANSGDLFNPPAIYPVFVEIGGTMYFGRYLQRYLENSYLVRVSADNLPSVSEEFQGHLRHLDLEVGLHQIYVTKNT